MYKFIGISKRQIKNRKCGIHKPPVGGELEFLNPVVVFQDLYEEMATGIQFRSIAELCPLSILMRFKPIRKCDRDRIFPKYFHTALYQEKKAHHVD